MDVVQHDRFGNSSIWVTPLTEVDRVDLPASHRDGGRRKGEIGPAADVITAVGVIDALNLGRRVAASLQDGDGQVIICVNILYAADN